MKYTMFLLLFAVLFNVLLALPLEEVNPEESGDFFEGDMELNEEQMKALTYPDKTLRNGLIQEHYRWPNNTVFYTISSDFDKDQKALIEKTLRELENSLQKCIKFKPRSRTTKGYISVKAGQEGCHTAVGYQNKTQTLYLQPSICLKPFIITHEFMHALGLYHQQSASDRDEYVRIMWDNISEVHKRQFKKQPASVVSDFGVQYDYDSLMHYAKDKFSKNGKDTIVPRDPNVTLGPRTGISAGDIKKLRAMYKCK